MSEVDVVTKVGAEVGDIKLARTSFDSLIKSNPKHRIAAARSEECAGLTVAARELTKQVAKGVPKAMMVGSEGYTYVNRGTPCAVAALENIFNSVREAVNLEEPAADALAKDVVKQDYYKSVCIVITTHTDDDSGDPFIGLSHILIIHFKLVDHVTTGSPVDIVHQFLAPYFPYGGLRKLDVVFDLGTSLKVKGYNEQSMELAKDVVEQDHYKSVCIVITTHTDDDRGDPFIGRKTGDIRSETNGAATLQCTRYAWSHATARWWIDNPSEEYEQVRPTTKLGRSAPSTGWFRREARRRNLMGLEDFQCPPNLI
ncbi:hypothetical protein C8R48DRAFT_782027 [Suillus tomentosus]|nr:hypothetical protein C8R48DRAFT_782027 [Suillus tomentosus]